jgi:hypothetical protein
LNGKPKVVIPPDPVTESIPPTETAPSEPPVPPPSENSLYPLDPVPIPKPSKPENFQFRNDKIMTAGGVGMAGVAAMSALEGKDIKNQIHNEIKEAKDRLAELEGKSNPNLERSLSSDSAIAQKENKLDKADMKTFKDGINIIFGKKGTFGFGGKEGLDTKEWKEIDGFLAKELVQYTEGESARAKLTPEKLKVLESPQSQRFIEELDHLRKLTGGVGPREREHPGQYMIRLIKFVRVNKPKLENLPKAA